MISDYSRLHVAVWFSNGLFSVEEKNPQMVVEAVRSAPHGDWKTQLVRKEFLGMEKGQKGVLEEIWSNGEGWWCRVRLPCGRATDIDPRNLIAKPM